ncbi:MAG: UDP-N-acetylglucosamine 4,6-dehydratase (inverting), partial [Chloroflexia bacterium]|nr:UDP-N-acetylglucosamine 4,6-dehydratase (inverting) [Chloroflexia bacterium]
KYSREQYCDLNGCQPVPEGYAYNSGTNPDFLSVELLRALIREHVETSFQV